MQPIDIINGALLDIGARAAGEVAPPEDTSEAFTLLNYMLDQWSNESMMVFKKEEVLHELVGNQYQYTIGPGGQVGCVFTGSISGNTLTVTAIASGAMSVGLNLTGTGIMAGTQITSVISAVPGSSSSSLGTYNVNLSQSIGSTTITGSASRPLKINSAIVRITTQPNGPLDYPVAVINVEKYELIGLKALPGPWPRALYYQPTEPLGVLNYWPNPSQGEMHLYCDMVFSAFDTLYDNIVFPQGYGIAMRHNLAELLLPGYGKSSPVQIQLVTAQAAKGRALVKKTNMAPPQSANFDQVLLPGKMNDAGWILAGGF